MSVTAETPHEQGRAEQFEGAYRGDQWWMSLVRYEPVRSQGGRRMVPVTLAAADSTGGRGGGPDRPQT